MSEFGISPEGLRAVAAAWQNAGDELCALTPAAGLTGAEGSAGLHALHACARAAQEAAAESGRRLRDLGDGVRRFDALTRASDAAAAAELRARAAHDGADR